MLIEKQSYEIVEDFLKDWPLPERIEWCGKICYKSQITKNSSINFIEKIIDKGHNSVLEMGTITLKIQASFLDKLNFFNQRLKFIALECWDDYLVVTGSIRAFKELYLSSPFDEINLALINFLDSFHPIFFKDLEIPPFKERIEISLGEASSPAHFFVAVKLVTNRAISHQIVRHRLASFLQESQRYCRYNENLIFIEPTPYYQGLSEDYQTWMEAMQNAEDSYFSLLHNSSPQGARNVLPNSCKTEIIVYANLPEWEHIFNLRTPPGADPMMRELMTRLEEDFKERSLI